jgi:DNA-directed RNA polymerase specialized sigma24 family protein
VVELRVFEGLTGNEIAARLGCTERTILRDWAFAKELLTAHLAPHSASLSL